MCFGRELDRDMARDDEQVQEEIRRLFDRYRAIAHQRDAAEREEEREEVPVPAGR